MKKVQRITRGRARTKSTKERGLNRSFMTRLISAFRNPTVLRGHDVNASSTMTVVSPLRGIAVPDFIELWRYRHIFIALIWRNVTRRYRQTLMGPFWFIVNPLVRMMLFSLVLGKIAGLPSDGVPYPIFTYTALLPWEMFASGLSRSMGCFISYHHIISKVYFPRLIVPAAEVFTALVDFSLSFVILLGMMVFYNFDFSLRVFVLPLFLALTMALSLSLGLLVAALQVRFRDVSTLADYVVRFWFYATPVAYSSTLLVTRIPETLQVLYRINPMNSVVEGFRWALLDTGRAPDGTFMISSFLVMLLLFVSSIIFLRSEHSIVDEV